MVSLKRGRLKEAMSMRERVRLGVDASVRVDWMREATWSPMRLGRVLPIMMPTFLGARASIGA